MLKDMFPAVMLLLASLLIASGLFFMTQPGQPNAHYAVVFNPNKPFHHHYRAVTDSGARVVRVGAHDSLLVLSIEPELFASTAARLRQAGALMIIPSPAVAGCFGVARAGNSGASV